MIEHPSRSCCFVAALACAMPACARAADAPLEADGNYGYYWPLLQTLAQDPPPAQYSHFGNALDTSGDLLVVGAPDASIDELHAGAAYVYRRAGAQWQLETVLVPEPQQTSSGFGIAVGVADLPGREVIAVGEPNYNDGANTAAGRVIVYERVGDTWQAVSQMAGGADYVWLGLAIDTDGDSVLAGAPATDAFHGATVVLRRDEAASTWVFDHDTRPGPSDEMAGYYGFSVAINGEYAFTGAYAARLGGENVGAAEIANLFADGPLSQRIVLHAPSPAAADAFGMSVAASGEVFAVGAPLVDESAQVQNSGAVFAYRLDGQTAAFEARRSAPVPQENAHFGHAVAFGGDRLAAGEPQRRTALVGDFPFAGAVYVFARSPQFGFWTSEATLYNFASNERMGAAVAIDGVHVTAGFPGRGNGVGAVQIHRRDAIFRDGFDDTAPE